GLLAAFTRAQGAFLVLPLAFEYVRQRRQQGSRPGLALLGALLPALGFSLVAIGARVMVGERHSGLELLDIWGYRLVAPWEALAASVAHIAAGGMPTRGSLPTIEALNLLCLLGFGLLAVLGARRLPL